MQVKITWADRSRPATDMGPGETAEVTHAPPGSLAVVVGDTVTRTDHELSSMGYSLFFNPRTKGVLDETYMSRFRVAGDEPEPARLSGLKDGEYGFVVGAPSAPGLEGKLLRVLDRDRGQYHVVNDDTLCWLISPADVRVRKLIPGDEITVTL